MNSVKKRISLCPNNFVKITHYACFFECSDKGRENWNALRPRGPFLFRSAGKGSKRGRFARHFGSGKIETREKLFGEPSQTQRLTAFQTHGKVRFCPPGKNPLTSHAVRCYKCCLGLPLAFCAAFRCSLRWRFTTRLFVHVFLPFGFFDKLCFKHFV